MKSPDFPNKINFTILEDNGVAEYLSKEVLLEWAKKKQYESLTIVADNFWQEVIDKLNEM